jgi:LmbE family N-acetylglucosaminyl deacetylase
VQFRFTKEEGLRLKGLKLQKIRANENHIAKNAYGTFPDGTPHVISIPMHYIDGSVPFSKKSIARLQKVIEQIHPEIVFSPDSMYAIDWHKDHIATGRNILFALKSISSQSAPKAFFVFQSFRSSVKFPLQSWEMIQRVNLAHKSQMSPLMIKLIIFMVQRLYFPWRRNKASVHQISLRNLRNHPARFENHNRLSDRIIYAWMNKAFPVPTVENTYFPSAEELHLKLDPEDEE